ncbi:MAG: CRTAC1 family protein [Pseudomonadota bacterium]
MRAACVFGALAAVLVSGQGDADVRFVDRASVFADPPTYTGGWEHFVGGGVAVFDCDTDTRPELLVAGGESPMRFLRNVTAGPGAPIAFEDGDFPEITGATGAYALDIDGDGPLDLVILRVGPNVALRGSGDCGFEPAPEAWNFPAGDAWSTAFSATWEAGAAWPTLAIGNYVDRADPEGPFEACDDNALIKAEGRAFAPPIALSPGYCALSMLISDWRRAGTPELRISNDRHYYVRGGFEEMWRLDPLAPRTAADGWPQISIWGMGVASGDLTGDGRPEVMLTSMGDQLLQINTGAGFENAPFAIGTYAQRPHTGDDGRPSTGWHAEFGDVDNDGRLDLFIAKGNVDQMPSNAMRDPNNLLMQGEDGTFVERSVEAGLATGERARGAALSDLDGDGRLDLVVVNRRAPLEIWQNESAAGNWLQVSLRQPGANTRAVGAWVELRGAGAQAREITVGGGHAGGQAGPVHFGLGAAEAAELRVIWPDGSTSDWVRLEANRRVRLVRAGGGFVLE